MGRCSHEFLRLRKEYPSIARIYLIKFYNHYPFDTERSFTFA